MHLHAVGRSDVALGGLDGRQRQGHLCCVLDFWGSHQRRGEKLRPGSFNLSLYVCVLSLHSAHPSSALFDRVIIQLFGASNSDADNLKREEVK